MKDKSKIRKIARSLFKASSINNRVNEKRVTKIVGILSKEKPSGYLAILKAYKKLIERYIKQKTIIVEVPVNFQNKNVNTKRLIATTNENEIIYKENPKILFGVKILHGDWIYDNTLNSKLENIVKTK